MKRSPLFLLGALALVSVACEQHPLPGQPPVNEGHGEAAEAPHAVPAATPHGEAPKAEEPKAAH